MTYKLTSLSGNGLKTIRTHYLSYPLCCCIGEVVVKTPRKPLNTDTDIIISLHSLDFSGDMLYLCLNNLLKNIFNTH